MRSITAFIFNLSKGGAQGVFVTVMNYFADKGYQVNVVVQNLCDDIHSRDLRENIDVHSLECTSARNSLMKLIRYVKHREIEYAWVFGPEMAVNLYIAKVISRKKFPIYARSINTLSEEFKRTKSFFRKHITHMMIKCLYHNVNAIVAQSKNMETDLIKNYGFNPEQVYVINNALSDKYEEELKVMPIQLNHKYFLYAGRLEEQKGLKMLLESFAGMKVNNVELYIVGEGTQKEELLQYVGKLGISHKVRFIGYTDNMINYYRSAIATVLTSYYEGFPNVLIESLSCGTPIVSFDLPSGPKEIITSDNGILVEYLNVEKMAKALDAAALRNWNRQDIKLSAERYSQKVILQKYSKMMCTN